MKGFIEYITEKLHLNKDTKVSDKINVSTDKHDKVIDALIELYDSLGYSYYIWDDNKHFKGNSDGIDIFSPDINESSKKIVDEIREKVFDLIDKDFSNYRPIGFSDTYFGKVGYMFRIILR